MSADLEVSDIPVFRVENFTLAIDDDLFGHVI